jgi:protein-tyrosine phosphatase
MTTVYWVPRTGPGKLGLMQRPEGGSSLVAAIQSLHEQRVDVLLSALTDWEMEELELNEQAACCETAGIAFWRYPIFDREIPALDASLELLERIQSELEKGKSVVVHCRIGIGRSGILAAGTLIVEGERPAVAINRVSRARESQIPDTAEQARWLYDLGEKLKEQKS